MKSLRRQKAFNLVELVIVIVVAGILATVISPIVMRPFLAYEDTSRRVELVDAAESALRKMARDIRDAIPNTVRTNGAVIEMMPIRAGGRYRYSNNPGDNTALTPGAADSQFRMLGNLDVLPAGARIVVYNTGATQFYTAATNGGSGIITPSSTTVTLTDSGNEDTLTLNNAFQFDTVGTGSPARRFYIATVPLTYHCDLADGTIRRYEGYSTTVAQPITRSAAPLNAAASNALLVNNVTACNFNYAAGSNTRSGLLTMTLTLTLDGEFINLLHQVHIGNAP